MPTALALTRALRTALDRAADPKRAPAMQAYMKSTMPYAGVSSPARRAIERELFAKYRLASEREWKRAVLDLWRKAKYREERYFAIELVQNRRYREYLTLDALPLLEEMIVDGAWWDYVDVLASHGIGALLRNEPKKMRKILLRWARDRDIWKRRSAILAQLSFKEETDLEFLEACIEPSLGRSEFFLRKAIGWALRQVAWTNPTWVKRYVREHELSPLSVREALKNVGR